jgi:ZIP family zinc transporter
MAAGSILYVIIELLRVAAKTRRPDLLAYGLLIGMIAGFATDAIVTAAGAWSGSEPRHHGTGMLTRYQVVD